MKGYLPMSSDDDISSHEKKARVINGLCVILDGSDSWAFYEVLVRLQVFCD